ncbi:MAG TPA: hypothetical protein VJJ47_03245 [Candidatus Paceibacterota bacterium]
MHPALHTLAAAESPPPGNAFGPVILGGVALAALLSALFRSRGTDEPKPDTSRPLSPEEEDPSNRGSMLN